MMITFIEITEPLGKIECRYYSVDSHKYYDLYLGICYTCETTYDVGLEIGTEAHITESIDGGHVSNSLRHEKITYCIMCGYRYRELLNCPGPNNGGCVAIMSVDVDETE